MKKKTKIKGLESGEIAKAAATQSLSMSTTTLEFPPPEYLMELALKEPNLKLIEDYIGPIRVLRDQKGFTFREIAEWLTENGVEADHNAVYRAYTKGMPEDQIMETELREAQEEERR